MEVTLTWDEAKLGGLVAEAQAARRRTRSVGGFVLVLNVALPYLIVLLSSWGRHAAGHGPAPHASDFARQGAVWLSFGFWASVALLTWPSLRGLVRGYLLVTGIFCLAGVGLMAVDGLDRIFWHTGDVASASQLLGYAMLAAAGVAQLLCVKALGRGSTIFACDYVRGEVTDWSVVLGLLSAEGPDYQRLREQVGLK